MQVSFWYLFMVILVFKVTLEYDLKQKFSFNFEKLLVLLSHTERDETSEVNKSSANEDALKIITDQVKSLILVNSRETLKNN